MQGLIRGFADVAVTPHHLATQAAMDIFTRGGNAVDAAIAANAVQGVVAPETCGIGGDLFALVHVPGDPVPYCLNSSGWAGSNNTPDSVGSGTMPLFGPHSVTIPGCVAGWQEMHERFGSLAFDSLLHPAIEYAEEGFFVSEELTTSLGRRGAELIDQEIGETLMPGNRPPPTGSRLRRPDLARTLRGVASRGREAFYRGHVAGEVSRAVGNLITTEDMAEYDPEWVRPLGRDLFGRTAWTVPPNSQGYLTLGVLRILEMLGNIDAADLLHLQVEAYRSLAWERDDLVADPDHAPVPAEALVSDERLQEQAESISVDRAGAWPAEHEPPGGTAYLAFVDTGGMGVSLIQSNFHGLGTTIGAGDAGFLLQNRGGGFTLTPGHPNRLGPRKRPLHTLAPTLWTRDGELDTILGTRGGHQQPQLLTQVAWSLFVDGLDPAAAQTRPRWTTGSFGPRQASSLLLEAAAGEESADDLRSRGHAVEVVHGVQGGWGPVSIIQVLPDGLRRAASDPRVAVTSAGAR